MSPNLATKANEFASGAKSCNYLFTYAFARRQREELLAKYISPFALYPFLRVFSGKSLPSINFL
jgi:hypothetical protein